MKVYYIFKMKNEFVNLYKDNPSILYNILKSIYYLDKEELNYGYNLINPLIIPLKKKILDRKIFIKYHQDIPYSKRGDTHYINNLYKDEVSRLTIKNSYIKLELEQKTSTFLSILPDFSNNYFICDFKNHNYYFLETKEEQHIHKNYTYLL